MDEISIKKQKSDNKKNQPYVNNFYMIVNERAKEITSRKNGLFYFSMLLLSVCTIFVAWAIESYKNGSETIKNILNSFNFNYLYLICSIFVIIGLLNAFPDFLFLYSKTKQRKFLPMLNGNIKKDFYNTVTMFSSGGYSIYSQSLIRNDIDESMAINIAYGKKLMHKIATLIYSFVVLIIGCCLTFQKAFIWVFVASLIGFFINCIIVVFVLYFDKTKERYLHIIGCVSKFLYRIRVVKNYEGFYKKLIDKLVVYNSYLKCKKSIIIIQIVSSILLKFLRHLLLFVVLVSLNYGSFLGFVQVVFGLTMMDLIFDIYPLAKGVLIYEIMFILLFRGLFLDGYLLIGMLIYRILDYFVVFLIFGFLKILEKTKNIKIKNKNAVQK